MAKPINIVLLLTNIAERECTVSFRMLFNAYYPKLYRMALYWVKSDELAEETVSEVFVKLWKNRLRLKEVDSLDDYLFVAIKRQALNAVEKSRKYQYHEGLEQVYQQQSGRDSQPEQIYLQKELDSLVNEAVEKLPERCRIVFQLVRIDGLKYKEVAEQLDISPKTVENQVLKATMIIRAHIQNYRQHSDMQAYLYKLSKIVCLPLLLFL